jgi:hypothetical protein
MYVQRTTASSLRAYGYHLRYVLKDTALRGAYEKRHSVLQAER